MFAKPDDPPAWYSIPNRFAAHSKGDDVRDPEEIAGYKEKDPLTIHRRRISEAELLKIEEREVSTIIEDAFIRAAADPFPVLKET